jgi:hypothetical protein
MALLKFGMVDMVLIARSWIEMKDKTKEIITGIFAGLSIYGLTFLIIGIVLVI